MAVAATISVVRYDAVPGEPNSPIHPAGRWSMQDSRNGDTGTYEITFQFPLANQRDRRYYYSLDFFELNGGAMAAAAALQGVVSVNNWKDSWNEATVSGFQRTIIALTNTATTNNVQRGTMAGNISGAIAALADPLPLPRYLGRAAETGTASQIVASYAAMAAVEATHVIGGRYWKQPPSPTAILY